MRIGRRLGLQSFALLATSSALLVLGCAGSDPDAVSPVPAAGTISYQGKPVESGTIQFVPEKGRPASGAITDGRFTLSTNDADDGAIPGQHQVAVTSTKEIPSKNGAEPTVVFLIPENFTQYSSSGVVAEVPPEGNTAIKLELK